MRLCIRVGILVGVGVFALFAGDVYAQPTMVAWTGT
jgi:hypothetical protein